MDRLRRGSALILVLIMTLSLAALASSAVYLASSSGLMSRYHDKERDLGFALESALELGKSRLRRDTTLVLYDTGYKQLLTNQVVYNASGSQIPNLAVNLYAGYTGDTSGAYVPYVTLLATVSDGSTLRAARRADLYAQSFARYNFFANDFPSGTVIGAGENIGGRAHSNNRFTGSSSGSPDPVFADTVSAAGTISGSGQWSDTLSSSAGTTVIPYPAASASYWGASSMRSYFSNLASNAYLSVSPQSGSRTKAQSGGIDISGAAGGTSSPGTRIEFLTIDVNNNGVADSTEGFMRVFHEYPSSYAIGSGYYWVGGADTARLTVNFSGSPVSLSNQILLNQCGAFYTIGGRREFFPVVMHHVSWVQTRIQSSTYPTVSAAQATAMAVLDRAAIRTIVQQPTARCFPLGSPYLVNTERFTVSWNCTQDWSSVPATRYTFGSSPACAATQQYGGQDTTFTQYIFECPVDQSDALGKCTGNSTANTAYVGYWDYFSGTNSAPAIPASVRQGVERSFLWPLNKPYNSVSRGIVYASGRVFISGTVRGNVTMYVNGQAVLQDDITYDREPADTSALCRNLFGLIARDSILVSDNVLNRPRVYDTPASTAGYTLTLGGNREFVFHGLAMALGGQVGTFNPNVATSTNPVYTCPVGSSFTAAGGCLRVTGGTIMKTYVPPYTSTTNSGMRPLRQIDPCVAFTNRRPPYFPLAATRVRPLRTFDVDVRQVNSASNIRAYYTRIRGTRAAP